MYYSLGSKPLHCCVPNKKDKIYVSDPAKGLLSYTTDEFEDKWYKKEDEFGMLMVLEQMANFKQIEANKRIERFKRFRPEYDLCFGALTSGNQKGLNRFILFAPLHIGLIAHE